MKKQTQELLETLAVIYVRVSSIGQIQKGHGLEGQEGRCREFARAKGYQVEQVFSDRAVSGGLIDRPGINAMLMHLRKNRRAVQYVVIIDDISRLARSIEAHLELRREIAGTGARLESPSIEFAEDPDSLLVEHLMAAVSAHHRGKNTQQVHNRMRERLKQGYWPFAAPYGYRHKGNGETGLLVRAEPVASIVEEALVAFDRGSLQSPAEVRRFIESHPALPLRKSKGGRVSNWLVPQILTSPIYAGYIQKSDWDVELCKGRHDGLISLEMFERIQRRLNDDGRAPSRRDTSRDFPLRGAVSCAHCGHPLTACWSRSKTGAAHPYYLCFQKGCDRKGKSVPKRSLKASFWPFWSRSRQRPS
jgi:DNA invertase Pin-like site-specific DNA recombinase